MTWVSNRATRGSILLDKCTLCEKDNHELEELSFERTTLC